MQIEKNRITHSSLIEFAQLYTESGLSVVPVPFKEKGPILKKWQDLRIKYVDLPKYFNGKPQNIEVILGVTPSNLIDIDLDSELAVKLADWFLPKTSAIFGRKGKPRSHWLYRAEFPRVARFQHTFEPDRKVETIVEIRGKGGQTIFPPSTHKTGEPIEWCVNGKPSRVDPEKLRRSVALLATACVLVRFWKAARHDLSLALAGALLSNGFNCDEVENLIKAICFATDDEEPDDRLTSVRTTAERIARREAVLGLTRLGELTERKLVNLLSKWFQFKKSRSISNARVRANAISANTFELTTLDELLSEPEEALSYVLEDTLITGGLSICSAKPKVGKSTFARSLARAIVTGSPFLGRRVKRGKVIYLCLEEKRIEIAKQFRQMGLKTTDILIHTGPSPSDALDALERVIQAKTPVLVIIDPLARVLRVSDYNDYASMARGLEPYIDLARRTNAHILALHHDGKGERDGGDAILGSTALYGAVDCHIHIRKTNRHRVVSTSQRYGVNIPETVIDLDTRTSIVSERGTLASILIAEKKAEVLKAIGVNDSISEREIKEIVKANSGGLISLVLRILVDEGILKKAGKGCKNNPYIYSRIQVPEPPP